MCSKFFLCCNKQNKHDFETNFCKTWLPGCYRNNELMDIPPPRGQEVATIESISVEHQQIQHDIEKSESKKSLHSASSTLSSLATSMYSTESRRHSRFSDSTFGDLSRIDMRLHLFEEDRFKDISAEIFKKYS